MRTSLTKLRARFLEAFVEELGRWSARAALAAVVTMSAIHLLR